MNSYNEHTDYKLTDLDYLTGDHHLQMMKAALPFLNVPQQRTLSMFVKIQELKNTFQLFGILGVSIFTLLKIAFEYPLSFTYFLIFIIL